MTFKIKNIYYGQKQNYVKNSTAFESSYEKTITNEKVFVNTLGISEDSQADLSCHGGEDRAICIYTSKDYEFFQKQYSFSLKECAFGENICLEDISDDEVNIGDIYSCGEVLLEVCQPRVPCWKISYFTRIKEFTALVAKEAKTGFNLRVLKEGFIEKSNEFRLEKRVSNHSIAFINKCFYDAKNHQDEIKNILKEKSLAKDYRAMLNKRHREKDVGLESYQRD